MGCRLKMDKSGLMSSYRTSLRSDNLKRILGGRTC
jgi:hypothetical protein